MANELNNVILASLEIEEPLEDIIIEECSCAVFECKLSDNSQKCNSYRWYKNGKCINPKPSLHMSSDGIWHRLEIVSANADDQGVYYILMETYGHKAFSYANLYVRPIRHSCCNNDEVLYMNPSTNNFLVEKQLLHSRVLVGGIIELEAKFKVDVEDYQWYRGDKRILQNERTIILNDKRTTTLSTLCADETDTGIYHVVAKTKYGVTSSFATVIVIDADQNVINNCEIVPRIIDPLIDDLETNEGEEIRLICKAFIDSNTVIKWSKKGRSFDDDIINNSDVVQEIYNSEYILLRILKPSILDTGEYTITLSHEITGLSDSSTCFLTVNKLPKCVNTTVKLKKPLVTTMASFGSSVLFTCCFDLKDPRYYFVVWYIGHYRVERTNHRFNVFSRGDNLFLFVKLIEPGMAGEVSCELHVSLPNRKSVLIDKTSARMTIVPNLVLAEEIRLHNFPPALSIYNTSSGTTVSIKNEKRNENGVYKNKSISTNGISLDHNEMDSIFEMTCCGLEDSCFYIDAWSKSDIIQRLKIYEKLLNPKDTKCEKRFTKSLIIEWNCENEINKKWYLIEFSQLNGDFIRAGVSSLPIFELIDPPLEQPMSFRIKLVDPLSNSSETHVSISPATRDLILSKKEIEIKPMEEFNTHYTKTGDLIGCGAFGSVVLVKDQNDDYYAAKFLKTRTQKKRETALREFQIMKNLRHSKLVELIDTFVAKEAFVLVMDYLWGGELFDRIVEEEHIKEVDVVPYVKQICEALQYLHNLKIAHLDLKPENIICLSPNSRQVKIIDFGLARVLDDGHETRAIYGTKDYVAPEVLNFEQLTLACDMWSLGVVTYMLLSGVMPFSGDTWVQRSANITMANYNYAESAFAEISDLAKNFVDHLLVLQPEKRMSSTVALNHQWILEGPPGGAKTGHMKQARENLKTYLANYRARWQRAGNVMIAAHRLRTHAASQRVTALNTDQQIH